MSEITRTKPSKKNLTDFAEGCDANNSLEVEVVVNDAGKVVVFHNRVFREDIGWFECDLNERSFHFIFDDGQSVNAGITVNDTMRKYMQNSHQILTVYLDNESGDAKEGHFYPLILRDV